MLGAAASSQHVCLLGSAGNSVPLGVVVTLAFAFSVLSAGSPVSSVWCLSPSVWKAQEKEGTSSVSLCMSDDVFLAEF